MLEGRGLSMYKNLCNMKTSKESAQHYKEMHPACSIPASLLNSLLNSIELSKPLLDSVNDSRHLALVMDLLKTGAFQ